MASRTELARNRAEFIQTQQPATATDTLSAALAQHVGPLCPLPEPIALSDRHDIWLHRCAVRDTPLHLVFSVGLQAHVGAELGLLLAAGERPWPVRRLLQSPRDAAAFPVDLLQALIAALLRKGSALRADPGLVLDRSEKRWQCLTWDDAPGRVQGLQLIAPQPLHETPASHLRLLVPYSTAEQASLRVRRGRSTTKVMAKAKDTADSTANITAEATAEATAETTTTPRQANAGWPALALPWQPRIAWQDALNTGVLQMDTPLVMQALAAGADPNGLTLREHDSFGHYADEPLLCTALGDGNEAIVRALIAHGAVVPENAIAQLVGWGNRDLIALLQAHGADIQAESVGMTALERAQAFKNAALVADLLALGAQPRRT